MTGKELLCKLNTNSFLYGNSDENVNQTSESRFFYLADVNQTSENGASVLADIPEEVDITRKQAAIIVHEYLKKIIKENDESDVSRAAQLRDLYDCRICVHHIEQVYCKGIMKPLIDHKAAKEANLPVIFGGNEVLSESEADDIVERLYDKSKRVLGS